MRYSDDAVTTLDRELARVGLKMRVPNADRTYVVAGSLVPVTHSNGELFYYCGDAPVMFSATRVAKSTDRRRKTLKWFSLASSVVLALVTEGTRTRLEARYTA